MICSVALASPTQASELNKVQCSLFLLCTRGGSLQPVFVHNFSVHAEIAFIIKANQRTFIVCLGNFH